MKSVYSAVRTGSLNKAVLSVVFNGLNKSVCSLWCPVCNMRAPHCTVAWPDLPFLFPPTKCHKRRDFLKKKNLFNVKCMIWLNLQILLNFSRNMKNSARCCHKRAPVFTWNTRYLNLTFVVPCVMIKFLQNCPTRCNCVRQFIVPWLLYMFRAIFSLIIRSI